MPFNSFRDYPLSWKPERKNLERPIYLSLALQLEKDIARGFLLPGQNCRLSGNWLTFWILTSLLLPELTSCAN